MEFALSDEAAAVGAGLAATLSSFGHTYWTECERAHRWPDEAWSALAAGGWLGLAVPEEYGGAGLGLEGLTTAMEALSYASGGSATFLYMLSPAIAAITLASHGSDEQRADLLPVLARGEARVCLGFTEPDLGADALAIRTTASRDGADFVVNGQKTWISTAGSADYMILVARTTPSASGVRPRAFGITVLLVDLVSARAAGTVHIQPIEKMGNNLCDSSSIYLDGLRVPATALIGEVDQGTAVLWDVLNPERILAAAANIGMASAAIDLAVQYASERIVFGRPIGANQAVQFPLAEARALADMARLAVAKAAWLHDRGEPCSTEASVAKWGAAKAMWQAVDRAMQTFGGMGYATEFHVERIFRNARLHRVAPVSEEILLANIAVHAMGLPKSY